MDDEENLPGPAGRQNWRQRNAPRGRGFAQQRGFRGRQPVGPQHNRAHMNRENRPASQTRQYDPRQYQNVRDPQAVRKQDKGRSYVGFNALQEMANSDDKDIITNVNHKRQAFIEVLSKDIERPDLFVLVMKIISKVCKSAFDELKFKLILEICNTQFISSLVKYLLELPYPERKSHNSMYWGDQEGFWSDLLTFCEYIITTSPSTAYTKYRSLLEASKSCLNNLKAENEFSTLGNCTEKLSDLSTKLSTHIKNKIENKSKTSNDLSKLHDMLPPDDFRWLNIVPTSVDLSQHVPFLRPNIIEGSYQDVEHYLDVQFRLVREDCFGPIREGVLQYKHEPNRKKLDNIRVFTDVKFVTPYITQGKVGCVVQIGLGNRKNKNFAKTKWQYNRRFIYGSLLLFTKDDCRSFIAATVLDRDPRLLAEGKIPVCIVDDRFDESLYNSNDTYTMIESDVYFEPYYHVMKALQSRSFGETLPMQQYIVLVQPDHKPPAYLQPDTEFVFDIQTSKDADDDGEDIIVEEDDIYRLIRLISSQHLTKEVKFNVLDQETWPTKEQFKFDESQYEAYKHALTHEFAVIQGPPGTGKTFIGLKIAETLLKNLKNVAGCLMLVICYTNHALDQFLSGILKFTDSVARIGGQSKDEKFDDINVNNLRKFVSTRKSTRELYIERKEEVELTANRFKNQLIRLDVLSNGILTYNSIKHRVPHLTQLEQFYSGDPLLNWLFEHKYNYIADFDDCLAKYRDNDDNMEEVKEETNKRKQKQLVGYDDYDFDKVNDLFKDEDHTVSFSLRITETELKQLISNYHAATDQRYAYYNLAPRIQDLYSQILMYQTMAEARPMEVNRRIHVHTDFKRIPPRDRWALYFQWAEPEIEKLKNEMANIQQALIPAIEGLEESRMLLDLEVLRNRRVIGMTTTGAARLRKLITALAPPIVIIEEAAEVLEQHIITSLTRATEHLILIGDHQQLRPSASHIKLARKFNLEVSLFERMIKNGLHSRRLGVQHRMRAEIAALISPHIYPDLQNHHSVLRKPNVRGLHKNLFFFTHDFKEEEQVEMSTSRTNIKEAELAVALANYIIKQGYSPEDITILTTYSGQMFYMRKERAKYSRLPEVKVTVVDNYQGEESKIIILSLVRNNDKDEIGFLGTENRICVALSRAQEGFYMFGNIDILKKKSELWQKIATTLDNNGSLGSTLLLKCERHLDYTTAINTLEDFEKVPEGGCLQQCDMVMKCGHKCLLLCHGYDRDHKTADTNCHLPCENILCELNHNCPLKCFEACGPCNVRVERTLACGHDIILPCHVDHTSPHVKCLTEVPCTLPACGHQGTKMCSENLAKVACQTPCIYRLECGHACLLKCHVNKDPNHEKYECRKPCQRRKKGCSASEGTDLEDHACPKLCYEPCVDCNVQVMKKRSVCKHSYKVACCEDVDQIKCTKKCARSMPCGHFCKNKCFEPCGNCSEMVTKPIAECGHEVRIMCKITATPDYCTKNCERKLTCGHPCKKLCREPCDPSQCTEASTVKREAPCGHSVTVPCNLVKPLADGAVGPEVLLARCAAACARALACGHACGGSCGACRQARLHVPCRQPCGRTNICGHQCTEPCNQVCPPCARPCEVKCAHSTCGKKCGEPCKPCQEECARGCPHGRCSRRCHEACSLAPCSEACGAALACGHACRGLCGEPCPAACRLCRPHQYPRGLIGEELDDDDRLIELLDCGHILTVDDADGLMNCSQESIYIRTCPHCRKPIINTNRYKDIVNNTLKNEIGPIKKKIYGKPKDVAEKKRELLRKMEEADDLFRTIGSNKHLTKLFQQLTILQKQTKHSSLLELNMQLLFLNILTLISDCYGKFIKLNTTELREEVDKQILMLCTVLEIKKKGRWMVTKISEQQQKDALNEIKRLNSIVQFSTLLSQDKYKTNKQDPQVVLAVEKSRTAVFSIKEFNEEEAVATLKELEKILNVSGKISISEIQMIIRAVTDVPVTGHWFKCPNGHFYAIGECGGAMQVSRCVDCGAAVGGSSHRLLEDNAHAREIDGSSFPRYSEEYNNMANFRLD